MAKELNYQNFAGIRKTVMACKFSSGVTQEEKDQLFRNFVRLLIEKCICRCNGSTLPDRDSCLDYILEIMPQLEEEELDLISTNKEQFYSRFCFAPTQVDSLYSYFQKLEKKHGIIGYYRNIPIKDIFDDYSRETGLSPYELPDEDWLIEMYITNIDSVALYDLENEE